MNSNPQDSALTNRVRIKSFTKSNDPITLPKPENTKLCCKQDYKQFIGSGKSSINEFTVTREQLPAWYGSNEYILHGYRRVTNSFRGCILSLFYLHNETGNVYTHLIGFIIVVQYSYYLLFQTLHTVDSTTLYDYLAHLAFMAGLMSCLALSTIFHLCCCHSRVVSASCNKADYVGIVALQVGSIIPVLYYGFYCDSFYQLTYMIILVILGIITIMITVSQRYCKQEYRWLRVGVFTLLGSFTLIPFRHLAYRYGLNMVIDAISLKYIVAEIMIYLSGAVIYAGRYPERWFPDGVFDIWGHSHQIWHLFVVAGAACHYLGMIEAYNWWHRHNPYCEHNDTTMIKWF